MDSVLSIIINSYFCVYQKGVKVLLTFLDFGLGVGACALLRLKIKTFLISGDLEKSVANNIKLVGGGSNKEGNVLLNGKPIW